LRDGFFSAVKVGDWVRVVWPSRKEGDAKHCYAEAGEVVQVCPVFIVLRSASGFTFCVSRADVIQGTKLKVNGREAFLRGDAEAGMALVVA